MRARQRRAQERLEEERRRKEEEEKEEASAQLMVLPGSRYGLTMVDHGWPWSMVDRHESSCISTWKIYDMKHAERLRARNVWFIAMYKQLYYYIQFLL